MTNDDAKLLLVLFRPNHVATRELSQGGQAGVAPRMSEKVSGTFSCSTSMVVVGLLPSSSDLTESQASVAWFP